MATAEWEPAASSSATVVAETTTAELAYPDVEPLKQRRLKVIHGSTGKVVTVTEILSPWNEQAGDGLGAYLAKRAELIASHVNLVEIDLLRGSAKLPMRGEATLGDYCVCIGRGGERPGCHVITWSLKSALPTIPIPLLEEDADVALDLAAVFRTAYEGAYYDRRLPYAESLDPPPHRETQQWINQRLGDRR